MAHVLERAYWHLTDTAFICGSEDEHNGMLVVIVDGVADLNLHR